LKKRFYLMLFLLLCLAACVGCGHDQVADGDYHVYYLNKDSTKIVDKPYETETDPEDAEALITELFDQLQQDSGDVDYKKAIPGDVKIIKYMLEGEVLTIYFGQEYSKMDKIEEALARAAIVRTMTQVEGVECVAFYVGESPLTDSR
jgi:germination protein M